MTGECAGSLTKSGEVQDLTPSRLDEVGPPPLQCPLTANPESL